jgi:hypothetical protein
MMSLEYIRRIYGIPARRGQRIRYRSDRIGTIVSGRGQYLRVRFDDDPKQVSTLHPTWEIEFLSDEFDVKTLTLGTTYNAYSPAPDPAICHWRPVVNPDHGWREYWRGECGATWEFADFGSPATDNDMRYCPWCGRALVESDDA